MFKIEKITLHSKKEEAFEYKLLSGINYFIGGNGTGKTVFYNFINYMFGESSNLSKEDWYESMNKAYMIMAYDGERYEFGREIHTAQCYFRNVGDERIESIDLKEYKSNLNQIFNAGDSENIELHNFSEEKITYRGFTVFNFLSEERHGVLVDFLSEAINVKNRFRLPIIMDFIFNEYINEILELQKQLKKIEGKIKTIENSLSYQDFIITKVNKNLRILDISLSFNGNNDNDIRDQIEGIQKLNMNIKSEPTTLSQMLIMYNTMTEQIKKSDSIRLETKNNKINADNRKEMVSTLVDIVDENKSYSYLINPLISILDELEKSIAFGDYYISSNTIDMLKKDREELKNAIKNKQSKDIHYTVDEKTKAILLINEYLNEHVYVDEEKLKGFKNEARETRKKIRKLKKSDDIKKIKKFSEKVTEYYFSASEVSSIVAENKKQRGFKIDYIKKGNILQPMIESDLDQKESEIYTIGSMARKTLIQLSGYLAFFYMFMNDNKYPIIPLLVIDHISKPFDEDNSKAIGKILNKAIEEIGEEELQVFIFSDLNPEEINISADKSRKLVTESKSGFNPFMNIKSK